MLCRKCFPFRQKIQKAFVHGQHCTHGLASAQQRLHKGRLCQLAGGVVGLAEEHQIDARVHRIKDGVRHRKIVFLLQKMPFHPAVHSSQCRGVLGKGGCRHKGGAGLFGQRQPEDEVCRAVAAQQPFGGHTLSRSQFFTQGPAQRVRVAVGRGKGRRNGLCHATGQTQRADIGRKIQRVAAKLGAVARPVAAMGQCLHRFSFVLLDKQPHPLRLTFVRQLSRRASFSASAG